MSAPRPILWSPNPGPQTRFLASKCSEVLYGGAAGGGKSAAAIALPLRWVSNPSFRCLYLRRESKYLGDAIDKSTRLYPQLGARFVQSPKSIWHFASGAQVWLSHCEHERDVQNYDSFEFHLVIFEELTHFTEKQYLGIRARIRGTDPTLPRATRSTCNPGGEGHDWVFRRWGAWLDPTYSNRADSGEVRWFAPTETGEREVESNAPLALSRTFIGAKLEDNPHVTKDYEAQLASLDPVRRAQLRNGDWLIKPAAGLYFKRAWFGADSILDSFEGPGTRCRYWDRAASIDGDWTVGARWCREPDGRFVVEDVVRFRGRPADVEAKILATAALDGPQVTQVLEQDPGQAGVADVDHYVRLFASAGFACIAVRPTGDKVTRFRPTSALCERHMVRVVRGQWNNEWFAEHEAFPSKGVPDDQVDTSSGAVTFLSAERDGGSTFDGFLPI